MPKKKPDNVADKPNILPYGSNVSAPAIVLPDVGGFKTGRGIEAQHHLESKLEEIKEEYYKLAKLARDTQLVYQAKFNFVPIVGEVYHLYNTGNEYILSLIEPEKWNRFKYIGSYRLETDSVWRDADDTETSN